MLQSSHTMRRLRIWLAVAIVNLVAVAFAQTNTTGQVRQLSLQEAIEIALKHNFDLQIDRYGPQIALYNLKGSYGGYDPAFSFSGEHDRSETGAQLQYFSG